MKVLDLYCGAGGAGKGYSDAGYTVTGIDLNLEASKYYPFEFIQQDAIAYLLEHGHEYDLIHASPPCHRYSAMQNIHKNWHRHPDLVAPTREALTRVGVPWVMENVVGAPLRVDLMLCGTHFGLPIIRHRIFELSHPVPPVLAPCDHTDVYDPWHGGDRARGERQKLSDAMGIDWFMNRKHVRLSIPPAYTHYIGAHYMAHHLKGHDND